jgi:hypothetical protein
MGLILVILLLLVLFGGFRRGYFGPGPGGILGLILVVLLIMLVLGRV